MANSRIIRITHPRCILVLEMLLRQIQNATRDSATEALISIPASQNPPSKSIMIAWKPDLGLSPLGQVASSCVHTLVSMCQNQDEHSITRSKISLYLSITSNVKQRTILNCLCGIFSNKSLAPIDFL